MSNQVTLTFAGDSSKLESAFKNVGSAADGMKSKVESSSEKVKESGDSFDRAGEAADGTYEKFDALESVGRGTSDTMSGLSEIMSGNVLQGSTDLAGGVAALADGFTGALLPAIKAAASGGLANAAATVRQTAAALASKTAQVAVAAATKAWAAAQWLINAAMSANPIGLVIAAVALLVVGIIYAYKHSETFRNILQAAFKAVQTAATAVGNFVKNTLWPWMRDAFNNIVSKATSVKNGIVSAFNAVVGWFKSFPGTLKGYFDAAVKAGGAIVDWAKGVPGKIAGFFKGIGNSIAAPFKAAFQSIKDYWNNTVGGKGFSVPGWIPGVGGKSFSIPRFHTGGIVPGGAGSESLAILKAGERVTSGSGGGAGSGNIVLQSDGTKTGDLLVRLLKETIRVRGGNVQVVLGNG